MTGKIKLVHSGGNSVSLAVPTSAPSASEVEFKLPQSDGSANQVLKTDGSGNLSFGADVGGKILQVVNGTTTTQVYGNSTSYADSGLTATITPASGTKILVILDQPLYTATNNYTGNAVMNMKVLRDSTQLTEYNFGQSTVSGNSWQELWGTFAFTYLDTHGADGSTAVTYKTQYKADNTNVQAYVNRQNYGNPAVITSRSNIQLLEVGT
tara:strand:+ start:1928 stop:2557 length:630 start_codon:yes stop_codon:yes gene_type:complete